MTPTSPSHWQGALLLALGQPIESGGSGGVGFQSMDTGSTDGRAGCESEHGLDIAVSSLDSSPPGKMGSPGGGVSSGCKGLAGVESRPVSTLHRGLTRPQPSAAWELRPGAAGFGWVRGVHLSTSKGLVVSSSGAPLKALGK